MKAAPPASQESIPPKVSFDWLPVLLTIPKLRALRLSLFCEKRSLTRGFDTAAFKLRLHVPGFNLNHVVLFSWSSNSKLGNDLGRHL